MSFDFVKPLFSMLILAAFCVSLFFLIILPFEIVKVLGVKHWDRVWVEIVKSELVYQKFSDEKTRRYSHLLEIKEVGAYKIQKKVSVRYGDISTLFGKDRDIRAYPVNKVVKAYRKPGDEIYVLENNSVYSAATLFFLSLILPCAALYKIVVSRSGSERLHAR